MESLKFLDVDLPPPPVGRRPSKGSLSRQPTKGNTQGDYATMYYEAHLPMRRAREDVHVAALAKKLQLTFGEVQDIVDGFDAADDGSGLVTFKDFCTVFLGTPWGASIPEKVVVSAWRTIAGGSDSVLWVDILNDFLEWYRANLFGPIGLANQSAEASLIYGLAKEMREMPQTIETLRKRFYEYDTDGSGQIGYDEFVVIMCKLNRVKDESQICENRYQRFWREADTDGSGEIDFEEFCQWYLQNFGDDGQQTYSTSWSRSRSRARV